MSLMMGALYAALQGAGVPEDKARAAAEEVASYESRISSMESKLTLLTWMVAFNLAMSAAIIVKLFRA